MAHTATIPRRRREVHMVQSILLIWLDSNIREDDADCQNTVTQLRRVINSVDIFTNIDECLSFLNDVKDDKACLIISGSLGQQILPRIHPMEKVDTIFIFCGNKQYHESWARNWRKIKGVFTDINPICDALKNTARYCERNVTPISVVDANVDVSKKKLNQLEPTFMYTQIMKEILLTIRFDEKHIKEYLKLCYETLADNKYELKNIDKFERTYQDKTPIWWYSYQCFLYPMLNRALRLMDVDIIIKMGFFLNDLHCQIDELYQQQFMNQTIHTSFKVYRGQGMARTEFERLQNAIGGLLAFNSFLSTSKKREVSMEFAHEGSINPDMVGILYIMSVNPSESTTPFASIVNFSVYGEKEDEVLFSMNSVFRIKDIKPLANYMNMFEIKLSSTKENDRDLLMLTNRIREEIPIHLEGWFRLALVLRKVGEYKKAQQVYELLLAKETNENQRAILYNQLGLMKDEQGEYREAIVYYMKAVGIFLIIRSHDDPDLAACYNNIGSVYENVQDYSNALDYYEKALAIWNRTLPRNHPNIAGCHSNIGALYSKLGNTSKAFESHQLALSLRQQSLLPNDPALGSSYNNLASLFENIGNYSQAYAFYEKAVRNAEQSLPPKHPTLLTRRKNLERVKNKL